MSFQEAGLTPLPVQSALHRTLTPLQAATEVLFVTIERETGARPAFDDEPVPDPSDVAIGLQNTRVGALPVRSALAIEVLQEISTGRPHLHDLARARAALIWDEAVDGRRLSEVDEGMVTRAIADADRWLGITEPPPNFDEEVSVFSTDSVATRLVWPVTPVTITSRFGIRNDPFGEGIRRHLGLDLAAAEGQLVKCAGEGIVLFAGRRGGYGLHVEVKHTDGYVTRYAHLSAVHVSVGDRVKQGEVLGQAGHTGRATGPHLHFELWRRGVAINPLQLLADPPAPMASR